MGAAGPVGSAVFKMIIGFKTNYRRRSDGRNDWSVSAPAACINWPANWFAKALASGMLAKPICSTSPLTTSICRKLHVSQRRWSSHSRMAFKVVINDERATRTSTSSISSSLCSVAGGSPTPAQLTSGNGWVKLNSRNKETADAKRGRNPQRPGPFCYFATNFQSGRW